MNLESFSGVLLRSEIGEPAVGRDVPGGRTESGGDPPPDDITRSIEWEMRRFLIIMRFLGWFWMLLLVGTTLAADDDAHKGVVLSAMVLATV